MLRKLMTKEKGGESDLVWHFIPLFAHGLWSFYHYTFFMGEKWREAWAPKTNETKSSAKFIQKKKKFIQILVEKEKGTSHFRIATLFFLDYES